MSVNLADVRVELLSRSAGLKRGPGAGVTVPPVAARIADRAADAIN
jgi:hypothetical protein